MTGEGWLKSIHDPDAAFMAIDLDKINTFSLIIPRSDGGSGKSVKKFSNKSWRGGNRRWRYGTPGRARNGTPIGRSSLHRNMSRPSCHEEPYQLHYHLKIL